MRYWMTGNDGKVYGPFEVQQLRGMAASGQLSASGKLCAEGSQSWVSASSVLDDPSGAAPPPMTPPVSPPATTFVPPPGSAAPPAGAPWTPLSLAWPVVITLFCCLIGGIVSIIYTSQANTKALQGNFAGAQADAKTAKTWMTISVITGVIGAVLYFLLVIVAAIADSN